VARKKNSDLRGGATAGAASRSSSLAKTDVSDDSLGNQGTDRTGGLEAEGSSAGAVPSVVMMRFISAAAVLHLIVIAISYLAGVRASGVQGQIIDTLSPYLSTFHLAANGNAADAVAADGVAFYLARGDGGERVYRLQVASGEKPEESQWRPASWVLEGGGERARRYQRFLAAIAELGASDQNALAGRLILPAMQRDPDADWVRIVRLPNLMTNIVQDAEPPPYTAAILRQGDSIRLVRVAQPRLASASAQER
jgi:hypothetical protein